MSTDTNLSVYNLSLQNWKQLSLSLLPSLTVSPSISFSVIGEYPASKQISLSLFISFHKIGEISAKQAALSLSLSSAISFPKIGESPASKQVSLSFSLSLSLAPVFLYIIGEFSASKKQHKTN
jgi:hypothetical protein